MTSVWGSARRRPTAARSVPSRSPRFEPSPTNARAIPPSVLSEYAETLARSLLIVAAVLFASATPARGDLVELKGSSAERFARKAGGTELVRDLRLWRVPAARVA